MGDVDDQSIHKDYADSIPCLLFVLRNISHSIGSIEFIELAKNWNPKSAESYKTKWQNGQISTKKRL